MPGDLPGISLQPYPGTRFIRSPVLRRPRHIPGTDAWNRACRAARSCAGIFSWPLRSARSSRRSLNFDPLLNRLGSMRSSQEHTTFLISFGSETSLGCTRQLTGRLSKARNTTPLQDEDFWEIGHFAIPKCPRPRERAQVQCLGDMPWLSRATAMRPDDRNLANARAIFKKPRQIKAVRFSRV